MTLIRALREAFACGAALRRDDPGEFWFGCLFWSFWLSLASFPIGYGMREVMPVVSFIFLVLYYRHAWAHSVLRKLTVRPLFYCLWVMVLIGVIFSQDVWASFLHVGANISKAFVLPFIAMECVRGEKDLRRLVWACVAVVFWQGLDGLWQAYTGKDFIMGYTPHSGRLTGSLGDYSVGNYIALALVPATALYFIVRQHLDAVSSTFLWVAALWPGYFLLAGASARSGALALAGAAACWMFLRGDFRSWRVWGLPAALLAALMILSQRGLDPARVAEDGRWSLWELAMRVFLEYPWLGAGAGRYNATFRELGLSPAKDEITMSHPHSLYLDMLYAHGVVGFIFGMIFLLGFLVWGYKRIRPRLNTECAACMRSIYWRLTAWFWIGYAAWLVNGIFGHNFYRMWWLALAMSYLGVMIGAVVNGADTPDADRLDAAMPDADSSGVGRHA